MFGEEEALNWVCALHALGYMAWVQEQGAHGNGVWCEEAGLLFTDSDQAKGWLTRRWASEKAQGVLQIG